MAAAEFSTSLSALDVVVLDTETTGLNVAKARLLQIGVVRIRRGALLEGAAFDRLINPGEPIPAASSRVHGITDAKVADADYAGPVIDDFQAVIADAVVVGHAIDYDLAILRREAGAAGRTWLEPRALDTRWLARIVAPATLADDLDSVCKWCGIVVQHRHTALGDARATAQLFLALVPRLRQRGIRTLAEAEAACRAQRDRMVQGGIGLSAVGEPRTTDRVRNLVTIDSFPYRHRVADVMSSPVVTVAGDTTVLATMSRLIERKVSSAFVVSGDREPGIVTERDLLRVMAGHGADALSLAVEGIASRPLHSIAANAFVYRAIGRMDRLAIRHLGVVDGDGRLVGALTTRNLLRHRATTAMIVGDEIDSADDVVTLAAAWSRLPLMARLLLGEDVDARIVAAIVSAEICAITRRAAVLAERRLADAGRGAPPVDYAVLVLGSAGRGESLLAADQDNAIVYAAGAPGDATDQWFEGMAIEMCSILDEAGIPFCKGGVMAKNAAWRMSSERWAQSIDRWVSRQRPEDLLNVDIFFDAIAVHGNGALADDLLDYAYRAARQSPSFTVLLTEHARVWSPPVTMFGRLRVDAAGRFDLKRDGLLPLVSGARVLSIKHGKRARSTPDRLGVLVAAGLLPEGDVEQLAAAHGTIVATMLGQQLADAEAGAALSSRVALDRLGKEQQRRLKQAVVAVATITDLVAEGRI